MSTLSGITQMVTPLAKSTPVTQFSQVPLIVSNGMPPVSDILESTSNEQARAEYLEKQMRHMSNISRLPSDIPPLELATQRQDITQGSQSREVASEERYDRNRDQQQIGTVTDDSLQKRVQDFCQENRVRRKQEWESHRMALDRMKEHKKQQRQQQSQEEWDVVYAQMVQEIKQTQAVVRSSIGKASTISDEE